MGFPEDFIWGVASSSYQIEGAWNSDGKGLSVWDMMCRKQGAVWNGHTGNIACDHYHKYKEDIALMKKIGVKAYRLSLSWPRIIPDGIGTVNDKGLDFYNKLIDELLNAGIEPFITLFHWDYPFELYCLGGWLNNDSPDWFAEYTKVVVDKLSDRVKNWITINEPQSFIIEGHINGTHAPGVKLPFNQITHISHNVLLSHGKAVKIIRENSKQKAKIGFAPTGEVAIPATNKKSDIDACKKFMFEINDKSIKQNSWWLDPIYLGKYPESGLKTFEYEKPRIKDGDFDIISQPIDYCAINYYFAPVIKADNNGEPVIVPFEIGHTKTTFGWYITPEMAYWGSKLLYERYKSPILITENGMANIDMISLDGKVHDPQRIDFTHRYLKEVKKAIEDKIKIAGYFHWSIMDNFEWAQGFKQRFGLIYVDFNTQQRTLKDSAYWYKKVIEKNGENI